MPDDSPSQTKTTVWVDADACPRDVKEIVFKTSGRLDICVKLVANQGMRYPRSSKIELLVVNHDFDAADDYICEHVQDGDLVITADVLLAERIVRQGVVAINPRGDIYDEASIAERVATRNLMAEFRTESQPMGGPPSYDRHAKQRFANAFDRIITRLVQAN